MLYKLASLFGKKSTPLNPGEQTIGDLGRELGLGSLRLKWLFKMAAFKGYGASAIYLASHKYKEGLYTRAYLKYTPLPVNKECPGTGKGFGLTVHFSDGWHSHDVSIYYRETSPGVFEEGNTSVCLNATGERMFPPKTHRRSIDSVVQKIRMA